MKMEKKHLILLISGISIFAIIMFSAIIISFTNIKEESEALDEEDVEEVEVVDEEQNEDDDKMELTEEKNEEIMEEEEKTEDENKEESKKKGKTTVSINGDSMYFGAESKPSDNKNDSSSTNTKSNSGANFPKERLELKDSVEVRSTISSERIPYQTIEEEDSSLEKGETFVVQEGREGIKSITYQETYKNGKLVSKQKVSTVITQHPINKIVKIGTKESPKYLSTDEARNILESAGLFEKTGGNTFIYAYDSSKGADLVVTLGTRHISSIAYSGHNYLAWDKPLDDFIEKYGSDNGKKEYDLAQQEKAKLEKAVRAATHALYGSGNAKANELHDKILKSDVFGQSY